MKKSNFLYILSFFLVEIIIIQSLLISVFGIRLNQNLGFGLNQNLGFGLNQNKKYIRNLNFGQNEYLGRNLNLNLKFPITTQMVTTLAYI